MTKSRLCKCWFHMIQLLPLLLYSDSSFNIHVILNMMSYWRKRNIRLGLTSCTEFLRLWLYRVSLKWIEVSIQHTSDSWTKIRRSYVNLGPKVHRFWDIGCIILNFLISWGQYAILRRKYVVVHSFYSLMSTVV